MNREVASLRAAAATGIGVLAGRATASALLLYNDVLHLQLPYRIVIDMLHSTQNTTNQGKVGRCL